MTPLHHSSIHHGTITSCQGCVALCALNTSCTRYIHHPQKARTEDSVETGHLLYGTSALVRRRYLCALHLLLSFFCFRSEWPRVRGAIEIYVYPISLFQTVIGCDLRHVGNAAMLDFRNSCLQFVGLNSYLPPAERVLG